MEHGLSIGAEPNNYIQNDSEGEKFVTSEEIRGVCTYHTQLLLCIDGYVSAMKTKRFHLKDSIVAKRQKYQKKIIMRERFLSMPITTKVT